MTAGRPFWRNAVPDAPRRRYTVHAGTNDWNEWLAAWPALVTPAGARDAVRAFEAEAARRCDCKHAVAFGAGRMALYAILEALDFAPGDEIVVPGFTCTVVPNAMVYRGIRPVYADIDSVTFNVDPDCVERAITPRTRAVYLQHTFGVNCDVERLRDIAMRRGLRVIEDAAHSLGARHQGRAHGSLGDVAFFSTDRTKVVNTHLGGCAVTNDDGIARRLALVQERAVPLGPLTSRRMVASFLAEYFWRDPALFWIGRPVVGLLRRAGALFTWSDEEMDAIPAGYPYPSRLVPALARLGVSQLASLDENLRHRRAIARLLEGRIGWYGDRLAGRLDDQAWLRYSFLIRDRSAFEARFGERIDLGIWFPHNIFGRERDPEAVGYVRGSCPVAERTARHIVNFPTHRRIPLALIEALLTRHGEWLTGEILRPERDP
jgi:dTDP-4-amino-4,6-dideoxygalactose transaminase